MMILVLGSRCLNDHFNCSNGKNQNCLLQANKAIYICHSLDTALVCWQLPWPLYMQSEGVLHMFGDTIMRLIRTFDVVQALQMQCDLQNFLCSISSNADRKHMMVQLISLENQFLSLEAIKVVQVIASMDGHTIKSIVPQLATEHVFHQISPWTREGFNPGDKGQQETRAALGRHGPWATYTWAGGW